MKENTADKCSRFQILKWDSPVSPFFLCNNTDLRFACLGLIYKGLFIFKAFCIFLAFKYIHLYVALYVTHVSLKNIVETIIYPAGYYVFGMVFFLLT